LSFAACSLIDAKALALVLAPPTVHGPLGPSVEVASGAVAVVRAWGNPAAQLVRCGLPLLHTLDLSFCPALDSVALASVFSSAPSLKTSLRVLSLRGISGLGSQQAFTYGAAAALGGGKVMRGKELDLTSEPNDDVESELGVPPLPRTSSPLLDVCRACPLLVCLDASYTSVTDTDVRDFLSALAPTNTRLHVLLLDSCPILSDHLLNGIMSTLVLAMETPCSRDASQISARDFLPSEMSPRDDRVTRVSLGTLRVLGLGQCGGISHTYLVHLKQLCAVLGSSLQLRF
jgi:hypothetical protein